MRKALLLAGALVATSVSAQQTSSAKDTVVVYGARLDQAKTEIGSSVSVITAADIEALNVEFVLDAVDTASGVTINQNGPFGGAASVRIRGASSEQTLVIVDGVVVNDPTSPGGGFDFSRLDPNNVERIEVLKGPQSTLWGTDAIGGVVNIITKRPNEGLTGQAFLQAGSYNSLRGGVDVASATDMLDFRLGVTSQSTDGISRADENNGNSEDDGYDATTVNLTGGLNLPGKARLEAKVLWTDAEAEFDSFVFGEQGNVGDGDELSKTEELAMNLTLKVPLFDGRLDQFFLVGKTDIDRENFSAGVSSFGSEGDRTTFRYQGTLAVNDSQRLAFGAERERNDSNGEKTSIDGLFALYEWQPIDELTLTAGLRRDDHETFGGETTGRLALAYNPTDQLTFAASWGEGFKAPTLFQTTFFCCGAVAPNPNLRPERSDAFDIGFTWRTENQNNEVSVTYFDQDTTDLITFSFAAGGYENIAEAKSRGVEIGGTFRTNDWLEASVSYAFIDAEDGNGTELIRVPEHSGDVRLTFNPDGRWSSSVNVKYNGQEQDPNGVVDAWTRVDVAGKYQLSEAVEVYGRIENLLDEDYQQIIGYGTPGLSGFVGARLRF